jgi:protein PET100, fungi type
MYIMFPIGWMYYFGTNLQERFNVPDFWPSQDQGHRIPFEREEIVEEVRRIARSTREREMKAKFEEVRGGGMEIVRRRDVEAEGRVGEGDGGDTKS